MIGIFDGLILGWLDRWRLAWIPVGLDYRVSAVMEKAV